MANLIGFNISQNFSRSSIPIYSFGSWSPITTSLGSRYAMSTIIFEDGTTILYQDSLIYFKEKHYTSLDDLFKLLPDDVVETILFNLEIFRRLK